MTSLRPHKGKRISIPYGVRPWGEALGALSYPLYAIHYPLIYLYIHWLNAGHSTEGYERWTTPIGIFLAAIALGYLCHRYWETPVRKWLAGK